MISFKAFIQAIHSAISDSSEKITNKNQKILDEYFDKKDNRLVPKTVTLDYPKSHSLDSTEQYDLTLSSIEVPLITLVPITFQNIEKTVLTAEFELEVIDNAVQIKFEKSRSGIIHRKNNGNIGKLEITLTPQETPEGLQSLIDSYEGFLKRQIT